MMNDWKLENLGNLLAQIKGGGTPSKGNSAYWNGDIPWCSVKDMVDDKFRISSTVDKISVLGLKNSSSNLIPKGTVITSTRMGLGRAFINDVDMAINQDLKALYPNHRLDNIFLLWLIIFNRDRIESLGTGSTVKGIRLETLRALEVFLPPLPTQRKIAAILSAYDDLIENNLKRIKLLEEKAQLTYEEWFSVKGTPEGWKQSDLGEVIDFHIGGGWGEEEKSEEFCEPAYVIRGTDINKLPYGSIQNVPNRWHKASNLKSRKLKHGDIVFEVSGGSSNEGVAKSLLITESLLDLFDSDVMCASFCKLIRPKDIEHSYALILFLKYLRKSKTTEIFEKRSASNIVNYNWEAFLKFQNIKLPEGELLIRFNSIVRPLLTSIYTLTNQIILLKEARDILLPRLMTGMIDVDSLDLSAFERGDQEEMLMAAETEIQYLKAKN